MVISKYLTFVRGNGKIVDDLLNSLRNFANRFKLDLVLLVRLGNHDHTILYRVVGKFIGLFQINIRPRRKRIVDIIGCEMVIAYKCLIIPAYPQLALSVHFSKELIIAGNHHIYKDLVRTEVQDVRVHTFMVERGIQDTASVIQSTLGFRKRICTGSNRDFYLFPECFQTVDRCNQRAVALGRDRDIVGDILSASPRRRRVHKGDAPIHILIPCGFGLYRCFQLDTVARVACFRRCRCEHHVHRHCVNLAALHRVPFAIRYNGLLLLFLYGIFVHGFVIPKHHPCAYHPGKKNSNKSKRYDPLDSVRALMCIKFVVAHTLPPEK